MTGALAGAGSRPRGPLAALRGLRNRLASDPAVQAAIARLPLVRRLAGREEAALMDLVAGFVHSQVLRAVVELRLLERLLDAPATADALGDGEPKRLEALLRAAGALGLLEREGEGWRTSMRGAALLGAPGAIAMIRHHGALYADLADPVALLHGRRDTELARVWPYVGGEAEPEATARYSALMAATQAPVAAEVLAVAGLDRVSHLIDAGGGTGAFALAAAGRHPNLRVTVVDLPAVEAPARAAIAASGLAERVRFVPGDIRRALPAGADAVSLVRILYDHDDHTARAILGAAAAALPPGGRLVVSEPMSGGRRPLRATDGYFALYCMAMGTGRLRSAAEIAALMRDAGFGIPKARPSRRPSVTSTLLGRLPEAVYLD